MTYIKPWDQRLANILVKPLNNTKLHPNHLTSATLVLGLSSAFLFALKGESFAWFAALLYMLAVFSDHMDGELARMAGKTSEFGYHYDYIVGAINYTALFIGIGYGLQNDGGMWTLILGLSAGLCNPFILYLRMTMEQRHGSVAVEHPSSWGFEIEDFIYLIGPITWFSGIYYFFVPYAIGNIAYLIWTVTENNRLSKNR